MWFTKEAVNAPLLVISGKFVPNQCLGITDVNGIANLCHLVVLAALSQKLRFGVKI